MPRNLPLARLLIPLVVLGCVTAPECAADEIFLADEWRAPEAGGVLFKRLLAVGITSDAPIRRRIEDRLVSMLRGREVSCLTSYSLVPTLPPPEEREKVLDLLLQQHVDGVLTVHLTPLEGKTKEDWGASWRQALAEPGRVRPYVDAALSRSDEKASLYGVEVSLWSIPTGERVWAGRTDAHKMGKLRKEAPGLIEDVLNSLIHARLI